MSIKNKLKVKIISIAILALAAGVISYPQSVKFFPFLYNKVNALKINLGLDLQGGVHLEYKADVSQLDSSKVADAMQSTQDVIERRVNAFGVGEPLVQASKSGEENRIIVELPGITNIEEAKARIGEAPSLEFKEEGTPAPEIQKMFDSLNQQSKEKAQKILEEANPPAGGGADFEQLAKDNSEDGSRDNGGDLGYVKKGSFVPEFDKVLFDENLKPGTIYPNLVETQFGWHIIKIVDVRGEGENKEVRAEHILFSKKSPEQYPQFKYKPTGLTGKNVKSVQVVYSQQGVGEPQISLAFDEEGTKLFADITKRNLGKPLAIFLDGELKTAPTIQSEITNGESVITGNFTQEEANKLQRTINEGALPVPLTLVSQQSIEASLGQTSLQKSLIAGLIGLAAVVLFMIFFYRFLGVVASVALLIYSVLMIAIFKIFGITLTLSGVAGFVLSIGMAVDANILIFERTKEELRKGRSISGALDEGFKRAWTSIRDGNISSILTAFILFSMSSGFIRGFAATLIIGVIVSMFTAVVITRTLLRAVIGNWVHDRIWLLGVSKKQMKIENQN